MHIQDTNVLNPGGITRRRRVGTLRACEGGRGGHGSLYKDGLFYYFSYRQERKGRREESGEHDENNEDDGGEAGWSGAEGEGLTAINFAKIGAYAVAGRQSNPSSALPPLR